MAVVKFNPSNVPSLQGLLVALSQYITNTITPSTIDSQEAILVGIQQTLINLLNIIFTYEVHSFLFQEYSLLSHANGGNLNLSPSDNTLINARVTTVGTLEQSIYALPYFVTFDTSALDNGKSAVPVSDPITSLMTFNQETIPANLTISNLLTMAQNMANAFVHMRDAIAIKGNTLQQAAYDASDRMYNCSQDTSNLLNNLTINTSLGSDNLIILWNGLVALPSILRIFSLLLNNPSLQLSQSLCVIRFVILKLIIVTNTLLASFSIPTNIQQPITAVLRDGETLMDFAARTTGDYKIWTQVATANALVPPYIGTTFAPGIAVPGQALYLPPFSVTSPLSSYSEGYLGTDIDFGVPFTEMTSLYWDGDFRLAAGLNNYVSALERRVLTTLGTLIYEPTYGSLLPPQAGNVQTANEAFFLSSFLKSALLADPRTSTVNKITVYPSQVNSIIMTAWVTAYGSTTPNPLNLAIVPQGRVAE